MCPLASPCLALSFIHGHDAPRCVRSEKAMREQGHVSHTNIYSLTYTHTALLFTLRLRFLVGSCSRLFPSSFALCPLFPILLFCTCHGNIYRHFFLPLFLGEFSCSTRLLLFSFFVLISFPLLFRSHTFTPLFLTVFAKCCQMFAVFPVVYFEALQNVAGFLKGI